MIYIYLYDIYIYIWYIYLYDIYMIYIYMIYIYIYDIYIYAWNKYVLFDFYLCDHVAHTTRATRGQVNMERRKIPLMLIPREICLRSIQNGGNNIRHIFSCAIATILLKVQSKVPFWQTFLEFDEGTVPIFSGINSCPVNFPLKQLKQSNDWMFVGYCCRLLVYISFLSWLSLNNLDLTLFYPIYADKYIWLYYIVNCPS